MHIYSAIVFFLFQAERKGATATEYGLVFGIFELVVFIISPIYGQHVSNTSIVFISIQGRLYARPSSACVCCVGNLALRHK